MVYTHSGTTGKIYFNGELKGTRTDFTLDMSDVGVAGSTTANLIGGTSWPDGGSTVWSTSSRCSATR